ncbi:hypothetical protein [Paenibacillus sp. SYP-B4298]|uniref:hypothetical protein n=1 Tax=Paenibacillus sp. SYP-B4298 TaxID=2996034 RepID=UPI0022DE19B8|nr:hypothetical protein [Paenibacillus sp. SYP-B4298]
MKLATTSGDYVMVVISAAAIKEFVAIEWIGCEMIYSVLEKLSHHHIVALSGSIMFSFVLKQGLRLVRSRRQPCSLHA